MSERTIAELFASLSMQPEVADPILITATERTFGKLTVDLAATENDTRCPLYIGPDRNTFTVDWTNELDGKIGWLNPPPGDMEPWAAKVAVEGMRGAKIVFIAQLCADANWFWGLRRSGATVYVLVPRILHDGLPIPTALYTMNVRHGADRDHRGWFYRWFWVNNYVL